MVTIKQNEAEEATELWIDGVFHASWSMVDISESSKRVLQAMVDYGIEHGKRLKAEEVRKVIGA